MSLSLRKQCTFIAIVKLQYIMRKEHMLTDKAYIKKKKEICAISPTSRCDCNL